MHSESLGMIKKKERNWLISKMGMEQIETKVINKNAVLGKELADNELTERK